MLREYSESQGQPWSTLDGEIFGFTNKKAIILIQALCSKLGLIPQPSYTLEEDIEGQRNRDAYIN